MFGRKLLKAVEKERESLGREHKGRALSSWPTSSVIMPWSRNEAFGSTPGFWEQRCELLMLAVGPAWHPLPFPSSPWLGRLPGPPPPPPPAGPAKRIRIKRKTCFSLASCSGPMTSPLQPPAPRFQSPGTFFPSADGPSILFEFLHFQQISKCMWCNQFPRTSTGFRINILFKKQDAANVTGGCFVVVFGERPKMHPCLNLWCTILRLQIAQWTGYTW